MRRPVPTHTVFRHKDRVFFCILQFLLRGRCTHNKQLIRTSPVTEGRGSAMAQVVSRWSLTAEARIRARVNPCGICGGQSGTGTGFSPSSSVAPCQYHSTVAVQTHIIWGMRNMLT
jgi:hypothetical protein